MANKRRLIDAYALDKKMFYVEESTGGHGWVVALEDIVNAPTVDAVEVVNGRWEKHLAPYTDDYWSCTYCNGNFMTDATQYWNYCPNCGARMYAQ